MPKSLSPAEAKAAKAEAKARRKAESKARRAQMWQAFQIQRKEDKRLLGHMPVSQAYFVELCRQACEMAGLRFQFNLSSPVNTHKN